MDEEKILDIENNENVEQEINVANEVVATIAGMAVSKIEGVAKMATGFTEGLKAISGKKSMSKGIKVETEEDRVKIEINIIIKYGYNIKEVGENIQEKVKEEVENMTGNKVEKIIVNVQGVKLEENEEEPKIDDVEE